MSSMHSSVAFARNGRRMSGSEKRRGLITPRFADDDDFLRWYGKAVRIGASPGSAAEFLRTVVEADLTDVLPAIRVPTLVLYRRDVEPRPHSAFTWDLEDEARRLAAAIPNARLVAI